MTITVVPESGEDVAMDRLEAQLAHLVEQHVLSASQAQELADAVRADRLDGQSAPQSAPTQAAVRSTTKSSAVLEVLGYVGGALVLGAVIMLGSFFWTILVAQDASWLPSHPWWCLLSEERH
jgi:hypothetical protein